MVGSESVAALARLSSQFGEAIADEVGVISDLIPSSMRVGTWSRCHGRGNLTTQANIISLQV
jgi:hypothetical protein